MVSSDNLEYMEQESCGMFYILGEKLRKLPKAYHEDIFDMTHSQNVGQTLVKTIPHPKRKNAKLLICYSEERARKDKADRERLTEKLRKKFATNKKQSPKNFVNNSGLKKYVAFSGGEASFNSNAVTQDQRWDGYFGIMTNNPDLSEEEILQQYRGLWQVESNFRVLKHNLSVRPVYHWTEKRIKAHILICFMSLVLERHLQARLKKQKVELTSKQIHEALRGCKKIILQDSKSFSLFEIQSNKPEEAQDIYKALKLKYKSSAVKRPNPNKLVVPSVSIILGKRLK
jgi:hypothetical protein